MNKLKHTPGPWQLVPPFEIGDDILICDKRRLWLATLTPRYGIIDNYANSTLMASAPEMLEAIIDLYKNDFKPLPDKKFTSIALRLLIEKATGQKIDDILKD